MHSDGNSDLSEAPTYSSNPFTIAKNQAVSVAASSAPPSERTRFFATKRQLVQKAPKKAPKPLTPAPSSETYGQSQEVEQVEEEDIHIEESDLGFPDTPGPASSISFSSASSLQKSRSKTSWIHQYCSSKRLASGQTVHQCNYCSKAYNITGGTSAFSNHLKTKHKIDPVANSVAEKRDQNGSTVHQAILRHAEIITSQQEEQQKLQLNKNTLEYLYIRWIVTQDIAIHQVSHQYFRDFLEYVDPAANRLLPTASSTIRLHAINLLEEGRRRLRHMLATALSDIHITCDMWTSPNNLGVLAIIAHFTSEKLQHQTVTLALIELEGEHTGLNMASSILQTVDLYGFRNKLGYFVMDNATSNDTLVKHVAESLRHDGVLYNPIQKRLRCNRHIINLVVKAFLFGEQEPEYDEDDGAEGPSDTQLSYWRKVGPLGKLHNIIKWIMKSPQRIQSFKKKSNNRMPVRDQATRWNSWFEMLDRVLCYIKPAIMQTAAEESDLSKEVITADEWQILLYNRDFLQSFYDTTKATEGRLATLDKVLPSLDFMAIKFEEAIEKYEDHPFMKAALHTGYTKLLEYWNRTERAPVYIAAIVLDPMWKWRYFDSWDPSWQPDMKEKMKLFWETSYKQNIVTTRQAPPIDDTLKNEFLIWLQGRHGSATYDDTDELERYISEPNLTRNNQTALDWWLSPEQQTRLPFLSKMAIDIYSIPAMSSEPERVFSGAKHTISDQRMRLKIETVELLECLKSWFNIGLFTEQELHEMIAQERHRIR